MHKCVMCVSIRGCLHLCQVFVSTETGDMRGEMWRETVCEILFVFKALATFCSSHLQLCLCLNFLSQRKVVWKKDTQNRGRREDGD